MLIGQFFTPAFCEFRSATFYRKSPPQKTSGYMGVMPFDYEIQKPKVDVTQLQPFLCELNELR
jgi:hypothetical protein